MNICIYIYIYMYTCTSVHKNIYNSEQTKTKLAPKSTIMFFFQTSSFMFIVSQGYSSQ